MELFRFKKLVVYQHARAYVKTIYTILEKFPNKEDFALGAQLRRSSSSVPSNIAEASGRFSQKEQIHFIEFAYGSLMETICQMQIAQDLGYINEEDINEVETKAADISKMLSGWRSTLLRNI